MHISELSVLDRLARERRPFELPKGNDIFDFNPSFSEFTREVVRKNREISDADDRPPSNTVALLSAEIELAHWTQVAKAYAAEDEGNEANDVLNSVMSQLKLKG
ncbi:hypothetical protein C5Y96_20030 [Blastopirellula marina]|uniref:Uncharacterized protein n=1 Tax=Blastopirellula marina TaxID=124 RepID=A0A2S8F3Q9_9BACT|nr:hypothetical protein C5Y96_20030 [Blastopirellula marina]RCS46252.1 hypothetical protein DTL36_20060 [Bremerella cremea]